MQGSTADTSDYPSDDIRLVIPNTAGGPNDTVARILGDCLEKQLGVSVVPENVAGASHAIGAREIISSSPDGYTLGVVTVVGLTLSPLQEDLGYTYEDVTPAATFAPSDMVLVGSSDSPYKTAKELFDAAKQNPGEISVGTPGPTSPKSVVLATLAAEHGVELNQVPFEGQAEQNRAVLGKQVDAIAVEATPDIKALVDSGDVVPLAVLSEEPIEWLSDTPLLDDLGYEGAALPPNTYTLSGPKGLPDSIVQKLEPHVKTCVESSEMASRMGELYEPGFGGAEETLQLLEDSKKKYEAAVQ